MQLGVSKPLLRLGAKPPKPEILRTWLVEGRELEIVQVYTKYEGVKTKFLSAGWVRVQAVQNVQRLYGQLHGDRLHKWVRIPDLWAIEKWLYPFQSQHLTVLLLTKLFEICLFPTKFQLVERNILNTCYFVFTPADAMCRGTGLPLNETCHWSLCKTDYCNNSVALKVSYILMVLILVYWNKPDTMNWPTLD